MSTNISGFYIEKGKREINIEFWQTPTQITEMIMSDSNGLNGELKNKSAIGALWRYYYYVKGSLNGVYNDTEKYEWEKEKVQLHLNYISHIINVAKTIEISMV